jgi:hypothetical protein
MKLKPRNLIQQAEHVTALNKALQPFGLEASSNGFLGVSTAKYGYVHIDLTATDPEKLIHAIVNGAYESGSNAKKYEIQDQIRKLAGL